MVKALDVAKCFINLFKDEEEGISNLKLQKLLYYAQGFSFQRTGLPLFDEDMEAWDFGPVVNSVYQEYKSYGRDPIRSRSDISFSNEIEELILDVAREYGQYTSGKLVSMTHVKGSPWDQLHESGEFHKIIPKEIIKDYFCNCENKLSNFDVDEYISSIDSFTPTRDNPITLEDWNCE
jgi:uncharacterized phage-associated protein